MTHRTGPGSSDIGSLERVRREKVLIDMPGERLTARAPIEPLPPGLPAPAIELPQPPEVRRAPVILVVAPQRGVESPPLLHDRIVPVTLAPRRGPKPAPTQPLPHGPHVNREMPLPTAPTDVGKPEKVKGPRLRPPGHFPLPHRLAPHLDQARLVRVQRQPVLREPLPQHREHLLGILPILKAEKEIVRVPDFVRFAPQSWLHHALEPLVEDVVQVDVGPQRADHLPLAHPGLRDQQPSVLQYPGVDPFPDQPKNAVAGETRLLASTVGLIQWLVRVVCRAAQRTLTCRYGECKAQLDP